MEKDYILPNFKLQFSHNIFPCVSVCQNSDEIKATDPHKDVFFLFFVVVSLYIYLQIEINHKKHHYTTTLDFTNDTFLFLISDLDLLVVHRRNNDVNYLIGGGRHAGVIWNCRNNAGEPIFAFTESNVLPIIRNTFFSSDLEYLGLQLVIQITLGESFANLLLLRWSPKNSTGYHGYPYIFVSQKMHRATLTDTKGYGPAWSIERSVKEQSVKETNKQLNNIQWLCIGPMYQHFQND